LLDAEGSRPPRRTALIAAELSRYNIDIAALSETRLADEGSLSEVGEGYTFFWKGLPESSRRIHGVGFAIRTSLLSRFPESPTAVSERLMTLRIQLAKGRHLTLISAYAPTLVADDAAKDRFYDDLHRTLRSIPRSDKIFLLGDFNARVGADFHAWGDIIGKHGVGNINSNGVRLLNTCSEFDLIITNTIFQQRNQLKTTWMHPRSKHWHLLDYVMVRRSDRKDVLLTRVMRGAECWTDHRMVRSTVRLQIRPLAHKHKPKKKLDVKACRDPSVQQELRESVAGMLATIPDCDPSVIKDTAALTTDWATISNCLKEAAAETLGFCDKKHQDWFDDNNVAIRNLLKSKNEAHAATLRNPNSAALRDKWKELRSSSQRQLRQMENCWWTEKAHQIQQYADNNELQKFYEAVKAVHGPRQQSIHPVKSKDGSTLIKDRQGILCRWAEHLSELLNCINPHDPTFLDLLPQFPSIPDLDLTPSLHEISIAVSGLKNNKASGPDDIPAEVLKHGGHALLHRLHSFIACVWNSRQLPQQWKDANIVTIYKRKGDRAECGNSRGISLLSAAGKVLARVMLRRLLTHVVDIVVPESQCGFRRQRSTIDMIFVARLLQEKCREQYQNLFLAFIDLTKAFDTVNRTLLWGILSKFGCPPQFLAVLREFHDGMTAKVVVDGHESDPFMVNVGVKQGCVLAPVIFNLFLVAVTLAFRSGVMTEDGVSLSYRLDGSLFNIRRLQTKSKISHDYVFELQYADDAALPSHTAEGLQRNLDRISEAYQRAGLVVNVKKTEILQHTTTPASFTVNNASLTNVQQFTYLGSILSADCDITSEINQRIKLASAAFGRLSHRVFFNHNLTISTKVAVYNAMCISVLLFGCETWTLYRRHLKALEAYHIKSLQKILGLHWWHKVTHAEIRTRTNAHCMEHLVMQRQLRWVGHVIRMQSNRLPRRILYSELQHGQRAAGGQKKRFSDHIKATLRKCSIPPDQLEILATDRDNWRDVCEEGLAAFDISYNQEAEVRRARRHTVTSVPASGPRCHICGRTCASDFGLRSHLRSHRPSLTTS